MSYDINCRLKFFNTTQIHLEVATACFSFLKRLGRGESVKNVQELHILMPHRYENNNYYKNAITDIQIINKWLSVISEIFNLDAIGVTLSYEQITDDELYYAQYNIELSRPIKCANHQLFLLCICTYIRLAFENQENVKLILDVVRIVDENPDANKLDALLLALFQHPDAATCGHGIRSIGDIIDIDTNQKRVASNLLTEDDKITNIILHKSVFENEDARWTWDSSRIPLITPTIKYAQNNCTQFLQILKDTNENLSRRISILSELPKMDS